MQKAESNEREGKEREKGNLFTNSTKKGRERKEGKMSSNKREAESHKPEK
jgi:hypothetical protein